MQTFVQWSKCPVVQGLLSRLECRNKAKKKKRRRSSAHQVVETKRSRLLAVAPDSQLLPGSRLLVRSYDANGTMLHMCSV